MKNRLLALAFLILFVILAFASCMGIGEVSQQPQQTTQKNGTPPVYEGISLQGDANILRHGQAARFLAPGETAGEDASFSVVEGDCFDKVVAFDPEVDPFVPGIISLEEKAADTLDVLGAASDIYYAEKNQDLYVVIRLSNPDNYEIQSFTLNGVKYANYMFEKGSDMENLILKINVGDVAGVIEYTLDSIKYIDGTEIKDVKLDGETTVKAGVRTDDPLTIALGDPATTLRSISFSAVVQDKYGLIESTDGYLKALLYDGETVQEKDLSIGENTVVFDGLTPNTAYQYAVAAYYDDLGGDGAALHTYAKKAVRTDAQILFCDVTVSKTSVEWDYRLDDECPDLTVTGLELYLDGEKVSEPDAAAKSADGLLSDRAYTIFAHYDGLDGQDATISITVRTAAKQMPTVAINDVAATQTSVTFATSVTDVDQVGAISKIELLHGDDATVAEDLTVRAFENILSNNEYAIRVTYTYDLNDGAGAQTLVQTAEFKTAAKQTPTVSVTELTSSQTEITGSLTVSDLDGVCTVDEVALYEGDDKVGTVDERDHLVFSGLQSGATYRIVVSFSYDLNDGNGSHSETFAVDYPTLVESIAVEEMILLNNNVVKHGEELNLRVYFINPSEIEITAIYVNGQRVTVVGGDRIESAIVKFVPDEIGLIDFAVDRVDYTYQSFPISQAIDSDVSVQYPIFGDLEINYTPITALPYDNSGDGVYLSFENAYGYTVYAINGSTDFVRFDDGQYYTSASSVSSIEYGYEHYGHTTQTCSYGTPDVVSFGKNYQKVSTAEEFLSMTDGYYYLTADLDLRNVTLAQPIAFTGVLIGNGHKIRGLHNVIDTSKMEYYDIVDRSYWWNPVGTFYDVSFTELYISVNATSDNRVRIEPLGGARLINCSVRGDIIGNQYVSVADLTGVRNSSSFNVNITLDGNLSTVKYTAEATLEKNAAVTVDENGAITCTLPNGKVYFFGTFDTELTTFTPAPEVFAVGDGALKNCPQLTEVTIPETVRCGSEILGECPLVRATLPVFIVNSLSSATKQSIEELTITGKGAIRYDAFRDCSNLTSVTIGDGVTSIGNTAFYNCSGLTSVTIPDSVTSIGEYAFYGCSGLTSVIIPDSVTSIGDYAFCYCSGLTSVTIPDSVTSIGEYAFYGCSGLTSVIIPNSVTSIRQSAFSGCSGLTSVTIPDSVTSIGKYAFSGCSKLTSITIPDSVTSIGDYAFYNCSGLTSVTIPDSVISIGTHAFYGCSGLTSVYYTGDVTGWCGIAFEDYYANPMYYARNLYIKNALVTELVIPDYVMSIGNGAFCNCTKLTSVIIPDSVTSIGDYAFCYCSGLTSVTIPDSVTSIGENAFYGCSGLTSVYYTGNIAEWCEIEFKDYSSNPLRYAQKLYINDMLLTELVIPDSVVSIGNYAFNGCSVLTSVTIPDGVTSIGDYAFIDCSGLTSIAIPDGITTIGKGVFSRCINLTSIIIPDGVTTIGSHAFYGCSKLSSVTIPDSVNSIEDYVFYECYDLTSLMFNGTKAQWNAILKESWDTDTYINTIHCTDGDIAK